MGCQAGTGQGDRHPPRLAIGTRTLDAVRQVVSFRAGRMRYRYRSQPAECWPAPANLSGVSSTFTPFKLKYSPGPAATSMPVDSDHNTKACPSHLSIPPVSCPCLSFSSIIFAHDEAISKQNHLPTRHTTPRPPRDRPARPTTHTAALCSLHITEQNSTAQHTG